MVCKKSEHIHVVKDVRPPTQGNKWPKISPSLRQDTIDEGREPYEEFKMIADTGQMSDGRIVVHPKSINNADYQQIVASLIDMRIDLKLEIQKLVNKVNRIDDHLNNLNKKCSFLTPTVSDQSLSVSQQSVNLRSNYNSEEKRDETQAQGNTEQLGKKSLDKVMGKDSSLNQKILEQSTLSKSCFSTSSEQQVKAKDEVLRIMENEIAEQDVTDEDLDLTSKL